MATKLIFFQFTYGMSPHPGPRPRVDLQGTSSGVDPPSQTVQHELVIGSTYGKVRKHMDWSLEPRTIQGPSSLRGIQRLDFPT